MFIERSEHTARCARTHTYSNLCTQSHYAVYSSLQSTALHLQRSTVYSDLQRNSGLQSIASQRLQTPPLPLSGGVKLTMHLPREVEPVVRTRTPVTLPASQSVFMNTFRTREVGMCSMNVQNSTPSVFSANSAGDSPSWSHCDHTHHEGQATPSVA